MRVGSIQEWNPGTAPFSWNSIRNCSEGSQLWQKQVGNQRQTGFEMLSRRRSRRKPNERQISEVEDSDDFPPFFANHIVTQLAAPATYWRVAASSAWNFFARSGWCKAWYSAAKSSYANRRNFIAGLVCLTRIL